jgi:ubiquinone/menaquinone biosynthesis C-methylase UbiE
MITKNQVKSNYYWGNGYDSKERFCSYWNQISEVLSLKLDNILDIGIGNGLVSKYLREGKIKVVTLDIDKRLNPDIAGSVLDIPLGNKSFDIVMCCEVLEHLPFAEFHKALSEIFRVSKKNVILSVPDANPVFRISLHLPKIMNIKIMLPLINFYKNPKWFDAEHYWEIGRYNFPLRRIVKEIKKSGFKIKKNYRLFELPYHRFFILEK